MISEEQQEDAALYALGLLDADEATTFERELAADGDLRTLTTDLREGAAAAVRATVHGVAPPALRARVLARLTPAAPADYPAAGKVIAGPSAWLRRLPWAMAAMLAISSGVLGILCWKLAEEGSGKSDQVAAAERRSQNAETLLAAAHDQAPVDPSLAQVVFCALEPVPAPPQAGPRAAVLWDAAHRRGKLRITNLPPAAEGKDYQLWTVEAERKDAVNAGLVRVGPDLNAEIEFAPEGDDGKAPVVAFALSVERAGGVPKNEGPIIYLGKL